MEFVDKIEMSSTGLTISDEVARFTMTFSEWIFIGEPSRWLSASYLRQRTLINIHCTNAQRNWKIFSLNNCITWNIIYEALEMNMLIWVNQLTRTVEVGTNKYVEDYVEARFSAVSGLNTALFEGKLKIHLSNVTSRFQRERSMKRIEAKRERERRKGQVVSLCCMNDRRSFEMWK